MGLLSRITGDDNSAGLGLPSRYAMPTEVRRERDREVGRSIARAQVITTDIQGIEYAGLVAAAAVGNVRRTVERVAAEVPEERAEVDSIAQAVAVAMTRKLNELAGVQL